MWKKNEPKAEAAADQEFDVYLDPAVAGQNYTEDIEAFSSEFACWSTDEETSREFKPQDVKNLLKQIGGDDKIIQVIGFNEFPYSRGSTLQGDQREVEREYWLKMQTDDKKLAGNDNLAILHVHYAGKWHPVPDARDRSTITQLNIRHTTRIRAKQYHAKTKDLGKWKEKHGSQLLKGIPKNGWKWKENPTVSPPIHKILSRAEDCVRRIRSLQIDPTLATPGNSRKALVVAVGKYQCDNVPDLPNAINDGNKLHSSLLSLGWDAEFETNLDLDSFEKAVVDFAGQEEIKSNQDACLFAFVGHGIEVNGNNYLVPRGAALATRSYSDSHDFERDVKRKCVLFKDLQGIFAKVRNGHSAAATLFILDCCRNDFSASMNQTTRSLFTSSADPSPIKSDIVNSQVIFSTTSGSTAADGRAGSGGPFMNALSTFMVQPGLTLNKVIMSTRKALLDQSNKAQLSQDLSSLTEEFYFYPPVSTPVSASSPVCASPVQRETSGSGIIRNPEAAEFWSENFRTLDTVEWRLLLHALAADFSEFSNLGQSEKDRLKAVFDPNRDGKVSALEFNILTKKDGLKSTIEKIVQDAKAKKNKRQSSQSKPESSCPGSQTTADSQAERDCFAADTGLIAPPSKIDLSGSENALKAAAKKSELKDRKAESRAAKKSEPKDRKAESRAAGARSKRRLPQDVLAPLKDFLNGEQVQYIGRGAVLGGDKQRRGTLTLDSFAFFKLLKEDGMNIKTFVDLDGAAVHKCRERGSHALEVEKSDSDRTVVLFSKEERRNEWCDALELSKRLMQEKGSPLAASFKVEGPFRRFGSSQFVYIGKPPNRYEDRAFAYLRSAQPFTKEQNYVEITLHDCGVNSAVGIGLADEAGLADTGMPGWKTGLGYHGDDGKLFAGPDQRVPFGPIWASGDAVGVGVRFEVGKQDPTHAFFVHNSTLIGWIELKGAFSFPFIVTDAAGCRLELCQPGLPESVLSEVTNFSSRIRVHSKIAKPFCDLATALASAEPKDVLTLSSGTYWISDSITIQGDITLAAKDGEDVRIIKKNAGTALLCEGGSVCLRGLKVHVEGGDGAHFPPDEVAVMVQSGSITIEGCTLSSSVGYALFTRGGTSCSNCAFGPGGRYGVSVEAKKGESDIAPSSFSGCTFSGFVWGLGVAATSSASASACTFLKCSTGLSLMEKAQIQIEDSSFEGCPKPIRCLGTAVAQSTKNKFSHDGRLTVEVGDSARLKILECDFNSSSAGTDLVACGTGSMVHEKCTFSGGGCNPIRKGEGAQVVGI